MRADLDCMVDVLLYAYESYDVENDISHEVHFGEGEHTRAALINACRALDDGGYVNARRIYPVSVTLTWRGQELAANLSNDDVLAEVSRRVDRIGGSVSMSELEYLAKFVTLEKLGVF